MKKLLAAAFAALSLGFVAPQAAKADKLQDIISKGTIRIGVPLDAPPFGSQDANRNPIGFDIELAEMVAKQLGVKLEMQQITGANRIPFLLTDKVDVVISVMGLTPERRLMPTHSLLFTGQNRRRSIRLQPWAISRLRLLKERRRNWPSARQIRRPTLCARRMMPQRPQRTSPVRLI